MAAQWIRKSGRTLERRQNTREGNPQFWVTFADGSRLPTEPDAYVAYEIQNSMYDTDIDVLVVNGAIASVRAFCSQCGPRHVGTDGLCERHGKPVRT